MAKIQMPAAMEASPYTGGLVEEHRSPRNIAQIPVSLTIANRSVDWSLHQYHHGQLKELRAVDSSSSILASL